MKFCDTSELRAVQKNAKLVDLNFWKMLSNALTLASGGVDAAGDGPSHKFASSAAFRPFVNVRRLPA